MPLLGGAAVFIACAIALATTGTEAIAVHGGLLGGAALMFLIGLIDDMRELSPPVKLTAQIIIASVVVFSGYRTGFFENEILNILLTVVWLVGITNAINLLDNMDGLAGGIALIAAGFISFFFWRSGTDAHLLVISTALFGGILGFLVFNFPPAKIFMGDSGSLLFGFTLAALSIAKTPQASNVFAVLGVPALLFALPILDTTFVTFTRIMRGQSPAVGGRDHTSHRLVAFGLSEKQTVLVLYGVAVLSGAVGAVVESFDYTLSLVLIPILLVSFAILAAYLSRLKVVETRHTAGPLADFFQQFTFRRPLFEIILDFFIVSVAYYLAFWTRSGFTLSEAGIDRLVRALPIAIAAAYTAFFLSGVYQGVWQYLGLRDIVRLGRAVGIAVLIAGFFEWLLLPRDAFSTGTIFLYAVFLVLGAAAVRSSFRLLDTLSPAQGVKVAEREVRVLILGTGEGADLVLRWLNLGGPTGYRVIGYLDEDRLSKGRRVHEIEILGGIEDAGQIIREHRIEGVIAVPGALPGDGIDLLRKTCEDQGVWLRELRASLKDI